MTIILLLYCIWAYRLAAWLEINFLLFFTLIYYGSRHDVISETSLNQEDPAWIGCWWLGFVICALLVTLFAIPIFSFPKRLSNRKEEGIKEAAKDDVDDDDSSTGLMDHMRGLVTRV